MMEKYCKIEEEIWRQSKAKARHITKEQWERLLGQDEKKVRKIFFLEKLQVLLLPMVSMSSKTSAITLQYVILWSVKAIKLTQNLQVLSASGPKTSSFLFSTSMWLSTTQGSGWSHAGIICWCYWLCWHYLDTPLIGVSYYVILLLRS